MSDIGLRPASAKFDEPATVIVGAGIGGLALAVALALQGRRPIVFEARSAESVAREGAFLTLAPNGMNALRPLGCHDAVLATGIRTTGIEILNRRAKRLALIDQNDHESCFGAPSVTLGRGRLVEILAARARELGVDMRFGLRVRGVAVHDKKVSLRMEGADPLEASMLVAADGLRSRVREMVFPEHPKPRYSGLIGTGGMVDAPVGATSGLMRMTFGDNAFFGYIKAEGGAVHWFNSYAAPESAAIAPISDAKAYAGEIRALHRHDPAPNATILDAVDALDRHYPVYDVPELPVWHRDRVVLIGDAAHAVGPHAGQGASLALEDAIVLAACLGAEKGDGAAFRRFEQLRRARVAKVVALTRRNGSQKKSQGRLGLFLRDLLLPFYIPLGVRTGRRLLAQRVDLAPLA